MSSEHLAGCCFESNKRGLNEWWEMFMYISSARAGSPIFASCRANVFSQSWAAAA